MDLSIIAIPYLSKDDIVRFIESIKQHVVSLSYEIILIDNSPNTESYDIVKSKYPEITIVHNTDNPGYARGMNQGYKLAKGKYIAFMNPDMELVEDCFSPLIKQLENNPKIGLIAPQLQYGDRTLQPTVKNDPSLSSQLLIILKLHHLIKTKALKHYLAKDFDYSKPQFV
ncbi:MAG: glycosyltransferase, partial [Janthinobacterium sp.]